MISQEVRHLLISGVSFGAGFLRNFLQILAGKTTADPISFHKFIDINGSWFEMGLLRFSSNAIVCMADQIRKNTLEKFLLAMVFTHA